MQSIDFTEDKKTDCLIPDLPPLSGKSLKLTDESHIQTNQLKINMSLFMPKISIQMLAKLQHDDPTFLKIFENLKGKKSYQHFFIHESVLFRKHRLANSVIVDQIAIPGKLALQLIKRFHEQNFFQHLGVTGMKRHL